MEVLGTFVQFLLLNSCFLFSKCDVVSFAIKPGTRALLGIPVELVCELETDMEAVSVYKTETQTLDSETPFAYCTAYGCKNSEARYHCEHLGKTVTVTIHRFDPYQDQTWWTCTSTGTEKQFYLFDETIEIAMIVSTALLALILVIVLGVCLVLLRRNGYCQKGCRKGSRPACDRDVSLGRNGDLKLSNIADHS